MKTRQFVTIMAFCVFFVTGCTSEQIEQLDKVAADANLIGGGLSDLADSPAGALLPPMVRTIMELLGVSGAVALGLWKQIRHNLTKETLKVVTKGVDAMNVPERDQVKAKIGVQMNRLAEERRSVTYSRLNAELDKAKAM